MESTLFTTLTANEEANFSGGKKKSCENSAVKKFSFTVFIIDSVIQFIGGDGLNGGKGGDVNL
ncbi:MAG: hypothetical protein V7K27_13995 [Nostoc sp.]|uniref:hypothetical protein n=1 Tax=Nostoc sp. TaxID=1180 RepID=UPI002FF491E7